MIRNLILKILSNLAVADDEVQVNAKTYKEQRIKLLT
jgi:hypothetical protein